MLTQTKPTINLQHFNWGPTETMQRDKEQSRRLHEPKFRVMTTDPISGLDIDDYLSGTVNLTFLGRSIP